MARPKVAMYLVFMEQVTREHIAAAAAAHQELGRDYDGPVAEGLVERIGEEIDKRVEAKLAATQKGRRRPGDLTLPDRHRGLWLGIGIGSATTGVVALIVNFVIGGPINIWLQQPGPHAYYNVAGDMFVTLLCFWGLLAVIFIGYSWVRNARGRE
jgi:hypothetical protein